MYYREADIRENTSAYQLWSVFAAAFFCNDTETALAKIEDYVRLFIDESQEELWADYFYFLADFMWEHGILTDGVRDRAIEMIDRGFAMCIWETEGAEAVRARQKALTQFREKLISAQPPRKEICIDIERQPIFQVGDLIALQLKTMDKVCPLYFLPGEEVYRSYDGKYIVLRKVADRVRPYADIEPQLLSYHVVFQLYNAIFDECPTVEQLKDIPFVPTKNNSTFISESCMALYEKRNCRVIGNNRENLPDLGKYLIPTYVLWEDYSPLGNAEGDVLGAILSHSRL